MVKIVTLTKRYKKFYRNVGSIWCPALRSNVVFNNHGWKHIRFNGKGIRRGRSAILLRFHLLKYAPKVIQQAKVVVKKDTKSITKGTAELKTSYYEIAYPVNRKDHVTVVLRKYDQPNSKLHYYSIKRTSNKTKKALKELL